MFTLGDLCTRCFYSAIANNVCFLFRQTIIFNEVQAKAVVMKQKISSQFFSLIKQTHYIISIVSEMLLFCWGLVNIVVNANSSPWVSLVIRPHLHCTKTLEIGTFITKTILFFLIFVTYLHLYALSHKFFTKSGNA